MGKTPCCDKEGMKKGPWSPEEDEVLVNYINRNGFGKWRSLPQLAGLLRCGKSCRLRWTNYLRPDIKRGPFTLEEEELVIQLHGMIGNKWAAIAAQLPGRTDNEVKNLWNTHLKKRLILQGLDPTSHQPVSTSYGLPVKAPSSPSTRHRTQWENARLEAEVRLSKESEVFSNHRPTRQSNSDHFLHLWNSKVGESFRKVTKKIKTECHSPVSQASCTTKCGSTSGIKTEMAEINEKNKDDNKDVECRSDSFYSNDLEDSSETALKLFFDFPLDNDMNFFSDPIEEYTDILDL